MADYLSPFFSICIIMLSCATICCYPDYEWDDLKEGNDEAGKFLCIARIAVAVPRSVTLFCVNCFYVS